MWSSLDWENERSDEKMPWLDSLMPQHAVLIGAALATAGWLYTGRRQRTVARKQHTLNVILQATYNANHCEAMNAVRPSMSSGKCPDITGAEAGEREHYRTVLNYFELLAAGIRNGDFDERMVRDTHRGSMICMYEACEDQIFKMRDARRRRTIYEHFEWLYKRWEKKRPGKIQQAAEWIRGAPFAGTRVNPHD